jgi:hypothetical protein
MSVSDGTPKRSLVARSMARISAAVTIFMTSPLVVGRWSSAACGASAIRIGGRIHASHKCRKIDAP